MDTLLAEHRTPGVKAKSLRHAGKIPGSISGAALDQSLQIQLEKVDLDRLLRQAKEGYTVELVLEGKKMPVLIKDIARNTMKKEVEHVGFQLLDEGRKVNGSIQIKLLNKEKVAAFINQVIFEIPYTAYPSDIFECISIDMSTMRAGGRVTVADLPEVNNGKLELLVDPSAVVLTVSILKRSTISSQDAD